MWGGPSWTLSLKRGPAVQTCSGTPPLGRSCFQESFTKPTPEKTLRFKGFVLSQLKRLSKGGGGCMTPRAPDQGRRTLWGSELMPEPSGTGTPGGTLRQGGPREASAWGSASAGLCPGLPGPGTAPGWWQLCRQRHQPCLGSSSRLQTHSPSCRLQSGRGVRPCQEKLSRGLPVRWDRRLGCQHHLTRFNLKVLFKKAKPTKTKSTQRVLSI